jgi:cytochrome bd-type quinol oxidase subunit 2
MNSWPALKFYPSHNIIIIIVVVVVIKITITIITQLHRIVYPSINQEQILPLIIIIIIIIIIISCHRFSFFPGISPLEPVVNPTTQASSLSL